MCIRDSGSSGGMYTKKCSVTSKRVHCCMHVSRNFIFFWGGVEILPFIVRTCLVWFAWSRVLYNYEVRTWHRTVFSGDNNFVLTNLHSNQHRFFWWDVYKKMQHHQQACTLLYTCVANFFSLWLGFCPSLYVRTWHVSLEYMKTWIFELISDVALYCTCVSRVCRIPKW